MVADFAGQSKLDGLISRLRSGADPEERAEAVKSLRALGGLQAIEPLLDIFEHGDAEARRGAVSVLGVLAEKLHSAKSSEVNAAGLRRSETLRHIRDALMQCLRDEDPEVVFLAGETLIELQEAGVVEGVSVEMVPVLAERGDAAGIDLLVKLSSTSDPYGKDAWKAVGVAVEALGQIRDDSAVEALLSLPLHERSSQGEYRPGLWTEGVATALGKQGTPRAVKTLAEALSWTPRQAMEAIHVLASIRDAKLLKLVREELLRAASSPETFGGRYHRSHSGDALDADYADEADVETATAWQELKTVLARIGEQNVEIAWSRDSDWA